MAEFPEGDRINQAYDKDFTGILQSADEESAVNTLAP
jgi:hypothetical protein